MTHISIRTIKLLDGIEGIICSDSCFEELYNIVKDLKNRMNSPLRVAVVGLIKAGKSTLMNALIGEKLLYTGQTETTYTVTWFKYGDTAKIKVYFKNNSSFEETTDKLEFWTVRNKSEENPNLDKVKYIEYYYPSPILKNIEFIDTPGLGSVYKVDENNSLDFLSINIQDLNKTTTEEAAKADAIIYAFTKGVHEKDEAILEAFQGEAFRGTTPINALGVLSKSDIYWSSGYDDPLEAGKKIINNLSTNISIKKSLYSILPVIGILGENKNFIGEKEKTILKALSTIEDHKFDSLIRNAKRFISKISDDIPVTPEDRKYIFELLGQYGVNLLVNVYRYEDEVEIVKLIDEKSGVFQLSNIIKQHFGNRADLIKMKFVINTIRSICSEYLRKYEGINKDVVRAINDVLEECERLEIDEHSFSELKVLQYYYNGDLTLEEEEGEDLLRLTGEYGKGCEAKLGVKEGCTLNELAEIAKLKGQKWNEKGSDLWIYSSKYYEETCRVLARSCEILYYHLSYLIEE